MDIPFERWKQNLHKTGLYVAFGLERLTNTRYADDILLYTKSLKELQDMTDLLIEELRGIGLTLNAGKTKILHTHIEDE